MKKIHLISAFALLGLLSAGAQAADEKHMMSIKDALNTQEAKQMLDGSVKFYFADQSSPAVAKVVLKDAVTNKKTNASGLNQGNSKVAEQLSTSPTKTIDELCHKTMLSALLQYQARAKKEGGNAVVGIQSYFKKKAFSSPDQYECYQGSMMVGVALKGDIVQLK